MKNPGALVKQWIHAGIMGNGPAIMPPGQVAGAPVNTFQADIVNQAMPFIGNPETSGIPTAMVQYAPGRANIVGAPLPKNNLKIIKGKSKT